jgi:lactate permease
LLVALSGYVILITIILIVQLIPQVKLFLNQVIIQVRFPEVSTSLGFVTPAGVGRKISLFGHIGIVLLYSSILAYLVYWKAGLYKTGAVGKILKGTFWRVLSSSVSILSMVTMSVIMENAGMTEALAKGLAESLGGIYPFVAPWIGALGAFMTGNNTNSNVVFGGLQMQTALRLGYPVAIILAAQTAGASLGSVLAPTKIAMGASTAGMAGREGDVMRKLIIYTGMLVLLVSLLTAVAARMM